MPPSHIPIAARLEGARRQRASLGFNAIIHGSRPGSATSAGGAMRSPLKATYALRNGERRGGSGAREQAREHRAVLGIARASVSQAFAHCPPLPGNAALPAACNPSLRHADCLQYRHTRLQKTTWATTALSKGATLLTSERSTLTSCATEALPSKTPRLLLSRRRPWSRRSAPPSPSKEPGESCVGRGILETRLALSDAGVG